jgi:hypothetical protein
MLLHLKFLVLCLWVYLVGLLVSRYLIQRSADPEHEDMLPG